MTLIDPSPRHTEALVDLLRTDRADGISVVITDASYNSAEAVAGLQKSVRIDRVLLASGPGSFDDWNSLLTRAGCGPVASTLITHANPVKLSRNVRVSAITPLDQTRPHNDSCILRLTYGKRSLLYLAHLDTKVEADLISSDTNLQGSVLAVNKRAAGEHPSVELLSQVRPEICVLCSNRPGTSITDRLEPENSGAALFRTDKHGIIEIMTDGRSVQVAAGGRP